MRRSELMIHLVTSGSFPIRTEEHSEKEQNNVPQEELSDQLTEVSNQSGTHETAIDSTQTITCPKILQQIADPTLPSHYCYSVINPECSTKIRLRKELKVSYTEENSSGDEGNLWGDTDSDNYFPSSNSESSHDSTLAEVRASEMEETLVESHPSTPKKGKKRQRHPENWKKTQAKLLKNSGKSYKTKSGKIVKERVMGPPCSERCILKCASKVNNQLRNQFFDDYWKLASLQRQRDFLGSCVAPLELKYRRVGSEKPRKQNCAFYVWQNGNKIRVCKTFLINTFGITERTMRTVIQARATNAGIIPEDKRGRHGNHKKMDQEIIESVRHHINSIPRVESHYQRQNTSREFIPGELTISEMHRNYTKERTEKEKPAANYDLYSRIFNKDFNIGFFFPRKDMCDLCEGYQNATGDEKKQLEVAYMDHQEEKKLSRIEKDTDKKKSKEESLKMVCGVYDLQAVLPIPMGQSSAFFYKSRLNCYNFTVTDIANDKSVCFFWHEGLGHRGAVEIGSCVLKFIEEIAIRTPGADIVFYSDNCGGQQKNRFVFAMYLYAVQTLSINSITHKYLIRGHTQNEGDAIHSIIEKSVKRAKKAGPIYVPDQLVTLIRTSKKKGNPLDIKELSFTDFIDLKHLTNEISFNSQKNCNGEDIKISEIKIISFVKNSDVYSYKSSYKDTDWKQAKCRNIGSRRSGAINLENVQKNRAYNAEIPIADNKKKGFQSLLKCNIITKYYESFFKNLA